MSAEPARHLELVQPLIDRETGEPAPGAPETYSAALTLLEDVGRIVRTLEDQNRMLERDLAGKRLRILDLERDREAAALDDPLLPEVEFLHRVWKRACGRRRALHYADRERISRSIRELGLDTCLAAICGAAYDPTYSKPQRNGKRKRFDDLELIFREYAKVRDFADRVPDGWSPDLERLAELGEVEPAWLEHRLGPSAAA